MLLWQAQPSKSSHVSLALSEVHLWHLSAKACLIAFDSKVGHALEISAARIEITFKSGGLPGRALTTGCGGTGPCPTAWRRHCSAG